MKRFLSLLLSFVLLIAPVAQVRADGLSGSVTPQLGGGINQFDGGLSAPGAVPFLGNVATRTGNFALALNTTNKQSMARVYHFARGNITNPQIVIPNWTVIAGTEAGTGAPLTVTASIEYPAGTLLGRATFSAASCGSGGSFTGTIADATTCVSDSIVGTIPNGAKYFTRIWRSSTVGIIFANVDDHANGDSFNYGVTTTDLTNSVSAVSDADGNNIAMPAAIIASTQLPSICEIGDSRVYASGGSGGFGDTYSDATGDLGELSRSIGPNFAYINLGSPSDAAHLFKTGGTLRMALVNAYCSHVLDNYGVNDFYSVGSTSAQLIADLQTVYANFPTKKIFRITIPPETTGAWTLANGSDQTIKSGNSPRVTFNDALRAGTTGLPILGFFEVANQVEGAQDSGKWLANGTPAFATADGVHESNAGYLLIKNSGVITASSFHRP